MLESVKRQKLDEMSDIREERDFSSSSAHRSQERLSPVASPRRRLFAECVYISSDSGSDDEGDDFRRRADCDQVRHTAEKEAPVVTSPAEVINYAQDPSRDLLVVFAHAVELPSPMRFAMLSTIVEENEDDEDSSKCSTVVALPELTSKGHQSKPLARVIAAYVAISLTL